MTANQASPSATWDAKSDEQKVEFFATHPKLMGWERDEYGEWSVNGVPVWNSREGSGWNPLNNWNHWRQVESRMCLDGEVTAAFLIQFKRDDIPMGTMLAPYSMLKADLPDRCKALFLALSA